MPEAIIFDVDGTLVDSVDWHAMAWQEALGQFGHRAAFLDVRRQIGKGGDQLLPFFVSPDELQRQGKEIEEYRGKLFKQKYLKLVRPFPMVRELFARIRDNGSRIALASSAKTDELTVYKRLTHIEDLVDVETAAEDVRESKPHPDIFQAALASLGSPSPEDVAVIGDTSYDAQAAVKAQVRNIVGVLCGGFPEAELRSSGCTAIFRDPQDLLAKFSQSPLSSRIGIGL